MTLFILPNPRCAPPAAVFPIVVSDNSRLPVAQGEQLGMTPLSLILHYSKLHYVYLKIIY
jgi:hypothetical protein